MPPFKTPLDYVILAAPYSGTGYAARVLTSLGVVCGHEHLFHTDTSIQSDFSGPGPWARDWSEVRAESSWCAVYHLDHPWIKDSLKIHLLRNPLKAIESRWRRRDRPQTLARLRGLLRFYRLQQLAIRAVASIRVCVEHGPKALAAAVGVEEIPEDVFDDRTYNTHMHGASYEFTDWGMVEDLVGERLHVLRECQRLWERECNG